MEEHNVVVSWILLGKLSVTPCLVQALSKGLYLVSPRERTRAGKYFGNNWFLILWYVCCPSVPPPKIELIIWSSLSALYDSESIVEIKPVIPS